MKPRVAILLAVLAAFCFAGLESKVTEYDLANGLDVIIYVDSSAPVVSTTVFYQVGAYDEPTGKTGISHMLEHMTFKHTDRYKPGQFARIVRAAGGEENGFTATYYTGFYETFAKDRWELSLELEAARMSSCRFEDDVFQPERKVVTEEWRLGENRPTSKLWKVYEATAYIAHPLGVPVIGWKHDIDNYTCEAVADWYHLHYNPANAVLVIAGDVRPEEVKARVKKHFGRLKGKPVKRADFYDLEPPQQSERSIILHRNTQAPAMLIGYHVPGIRNKEFYTAEVLEAILVQGRTSRLYQALVTRTGLATWVGGGDYTTRDPGLFTIYITPKSEKDIPEISQVIEQELTKLKTELVTDHEFAKVQNQVLAQDVFDQDDISDMAYFLARCQITAGSWRFLEQYPDQIRKVTKAQVQEFCRHYFKTDNRTTALLLPKKEEK